MVNKIAWEMMNPDYQKRKPTTVKKKDPVYKTAASKKTSATKTKINAESENKKRTSSDINYDLLDELFNDENSPKRAKLEKPVVVGDQIVYSHQSSEECPLKPQGSEEEEDLNEDYSNEDTYGGVEEFYDDADLELIHTKDIKQSCQNT
uniref:Brf1 TBP-binding domain-containing protein n=1 Tax=Noccaea caerulescens TaxID=107243 RepID=A0A1J3EQU6_NOCCA